MLACQRIAGATKFLEDQLLLVRRDADASVGDRDRDEAGIGLGLERDESPFGRELDRVRKQVLQNLVEFGRVLPQRWQARIDLIAQVDFFALGEWAEHINQALAEL